MTERELMYFMKRILESGSNEKSEASLHQLEQILKMQNASPQMIELVDQTIAGIPEVKDAAKKETLTREELQIAIRRAQERKAWQEEMASRGRC